MKIVIGLYLMAELLLLFFAYFGVFWGWEGLFFYHTEDELGHMCAYLGKRFDLRMFDKHYSWIRRA